MQAAVKLPHGLRTPVLLRLVRLRSRAGPNASSGRPLSSVLAATTDIPVHGPLAAWTQARGSPWEEVSLIKYPAVDTGLSLSKVQDMGSFLSAMDPRKPALCGGLAARLPVARLAALQSGWGLPRTFSAAMSTSSNPPSACGPQDPTQLTALSTSSLEKPAPDVPLPTLHGKNLLDLVSIARSSHGRDWSESAGAVDDSDQLSIMDPQYDLTTAKLRQLFALFHPNVDGVLSYEGFRRGLEAMGISCEDEQQFRAFINKVDDDNSGGITYQEFLFAIQEIKLAQLFSPDFLRELPSEASHSRTGASEPTVLRTVEYSPERIRSVSPIEQVEKFLYSRSPSWASVRWINVEGVDALTMRRLSVRYRLHPLAVQDTLGADLERPKYELYDEHASLVLQTVHARDLQLAMEYQAMYRASLYVREDTVSPFEAMDKPELLRRLGELAKGRIMAPPEQLSVFVLQNTVISVQESRSSLWPSLQQRLQASYSKVRQSHASFLVYELLDVCVDELSPIAHTFGAKVALLERLMRLDPTGFDVERLANCAKEVKGLQMLCKPLREVVLQLAASAAYEGETQRYLRDVQDHVTAVDEACDRHLDRCRSLVEDCHNARLARQSDVSYTLTLVATIFLPAQFLTGLYGMNFEDMPGIEHEHGYAIWWGVLLAISSATLSFFKFFKKWI